MSPDHKALAFAMAGGAGSCLHPLTTDGGVMVVRRGFFPPRTRASHFLAPEPAEPSAGRMRRREMPA